MFRLNGTQLTTAADCETKQNALQARITSLKTEEVDIVSRQDKLKKELYGRFGDSINLES